MGTTFVNDITYTTQIVAVTCDCGLVYGLSKEFIAARREDHRTFYCPNGCSWWYPQKNEAEQLKAQLEASRSLAQREARRRESAERSARAYKGVATRTRRRVANGVCPCCTRTFPDVAAHMAAKHPEYVADANGSTPSEPA